MPCKKRGEEKREKVEPFFLLNIFLPLGAQRFIKRSLYAKKKAYQRQNHGRGADKEEDQWKHLDRCVNAMKIKMRFGCVVVNSV